ncbi:hypothetical protein FAI41_04235 [Acetobacteraceae bacterium]|nr:hypothetical protein FAI41_04235 [Acetobacteraceae bacterium]
MSFFKERFGIENALAEDFDPEESRIPKGQEGGGRWTAEGEGNSEKNEGFLEEKVKKFQDDFRSLAEKNGENTLVSEIERHCEHFIEENFERNTTDFFDLSKNLTETDSADLKDLLRENPLKLLSKGMRAKNIAVQLAISLLEHILKKGLRLSGKSSLRFPIRNNLAPWLEREGKWMGKKGSSNTVRIMEPSEDPYQSALNFVRSVRKYKAKQGIASKELMDESYKGYRMLKIKFDDDTYISIRKAGDSGRQTPDDQVTVGIKGPQFGKNQRKFKFPETIKGINK